MFRIIVILCIISAAISIGAFGFASNAIAADFSELKREFTANTITKVIDPVTVLAKDGTIYNLVGLDVPESMQPDTPKAVQALLEGAEVRVYQTKTADTGRLNRMGHVMAHLQIRQGENEGTWVQGYLLEQGLARTYTPRSNPEMIAQMYKAEEKARAASVGLWANPDNAIKAPDTAAQYTNSFQIVEGRVKSVAILGTKIFINFGNNWRDDFTIGIEPEVRRILAHANIDPQQWANKPIRVRGWIENYNGPYIKLDDIYQLEFNNLGVLPIKPRVTGKSLAQAKPEGTQSQGQMGMGSGKKNAMGYIKAPAQPAINTPDIDVPTVDGTASEKEKMPEKTILQQLLNE